MVAHGHDRSYIWSQAKVYNYQSARVLCWDATLERYAGIEFNSRLYTLERTERYWQAIVEAAGDDDKEMIVSLSELIGFASANQ